MEYSFTFMDPNIVLFAVAGGVAAIIFAIYCFYAYFTHRGGKGRLWTLLRSSPRQGKGFLEHARPPTSSMAHAVDCAVDQHDH